MTATWTASKAFERVIEALEREGKRVTGAGRQRSGQCPVPVHSHDDRRPSLSITDGMERVLLRCHRGCEIDDILQALNLSRRDLFDAPRERSADEDNWAPWQLDNGCPCAPVARYDYVDEAGRLLYQVVRGEHKEFSQRRPDPSSRSGWRWKLDEPGHETRRVLYRLPKILAAPSSAVIWCVEGEKDVHALEAAGEIATTGGGAGKWRPEYAEPLAGREVLIVADRDQPGREHAEQVAASLSGTARFLWIVEAAEGKDAADHLAAGLGVRDFVWWSQ